MKLDVNNLKEKLTLLGYGVSKSNVVLIHQLIELSEENGSLYGYTNNADIMVKIKICDNVPKDSKILVYYNTFNDIIKSCSDDEIDLDVVKGNILKIKSKHINCKISTYNDKSVKHPKIETDSTVDTSKFKDYLPLCRNIIDSDFSVECYKYIYFGDNIMVSDTDNVLVIDEKPFNHNVLLSPNSVELLSRFDSFDYKFTTTKVKLGNEMIEQNFLLLSKDDIVINLTSYSLKDYQYDDLAGLFDATFNEKITLNSSDISKALSYRKIFIGNPLLVLNNKGVFITIEDSDFIYKLDDTHCNNHTYTLSDKLIKGLTNSDTITLEYENDVLVGFLKVTTPDSVAIYEAKEIKENGADE